MSLPVRGTGRVLEKSVGLFLGNVSWQAKDERQIEWHVDGSNIF